jgi:hypothetical protein
MHNKYPSGSEWRKWDFHIHTPASVLNNQFGDNWDEYVKTLFRKAIENEIAAIGITDYFNIEGYKKIKKEYLSSESRLEKLFNDDEIEKIKNIMVFPNIEFRINKLVISGEENLTWNNKVNLHLLLSDEIEIEDIEENILHCLTFEDLGDPDFKSQNSTLTMRNLGNLGKRLKQEHQKFRSKSDIFVGIMNASINDSHLLDQLNTKKETFEGKYLIGLSADEDLSLVSWNSQGHLSRKVLIQKSNFLFSSNINTIKFGLGYFHSTKENFINEFRSLKPCIWGSDAHDFKRLFKPDEEKYTWIKANPTFEGLKQIIYEPQYRVIVNENKPESKTSYLVIDKARFMDNTVNKCFDPNWISFNQNLNIIIGGKSSGKSLLLYHIAKSIDRKQVLEKTDGILPNSYEEFNKDNPFDFEVLWKDGTQNKLSFLFDEAKNKITYIPQLYINHLAEEKGEKHLASLIESILLQNVPYKSLKEKKDASIHNALASIKSNIELLISLRNDFSRIKNDKLVLGEKKSIEAEIEHLSKDIDRLRKESGFSQLENTKYEKLIKEKKNYELILQKYLSIKDSIFDYSSNILKLEEYAKDYLDRNKNEYENDDKEIFYINKLHNILNLSLNSTFKKFSVESKTVIDQINKTISILDNELSIRNQMISPFQEKIKNQKYLLSLTVLLNKEQNKLISLNEKDKELRRIAERGKQISSNIITKYEEMFYSYIELENELKKNEYYKIGNDLELNCVIMFDVEKFSSFTNLFDGRSKFNTIFYGAFDNDNVFRFDKERHCSTIRQIYDQLRESEKLGLRIKGGINETTIYEKLFSDYFNFKYTINYKGDNILKMSPGKRGVVLLELILHLSNATHPILIDQPEDNLDNRTIYDNLKQFIVEKKMQRQIIIVTHNANLAVSTDAENIIVANQAGQQIGKDKKEYTFEYISGALENTFIRESEDGILYKYGIREHVCDILEGGKEAFKKREQKYGIFKRI